MKLEKNMCFEHLILFGTKLQDRSFLSCTFHDCTFDDLELEGCLFTDCIFTDCSISHLKGSNSILSSCHIRKCRLFSNNWDDLCSGNSVSAVLKTMEDCIIEEDRFCGQDLSGLQLFSCKIHNCVFDTCRMRSMRFFSCMMKGTRFLRCDLTGTVLPAS